MGCLWSVLMDDVQNENGDLTCKYLLDICTAKPVCDTQHDTWTYYLQSVYHVVISPLHACLCKVFSVYTKKRLSFIPNRTCASGQPHIRTSFRTNSCISWFANTSDYHQKLYNDHLSFNKLWWQYWWLISCSKNMLDTHSWTIIRIVKQIWVHPSTMFPQIR